MDDDVWRGAGPAGRAPHAGADGPAPTPRRRMSAARKWDAVLRLLRGEDLELVSRDLGVTAAVSAARAKGTYLRDKFHRLRAHTGAKNGRTRARRRWPWRARTRPRSRCSTS